VAAYPQQDQGHIHQDAEAPRFLEAFLEADLQRFLVEQQTAPCTRLQGTFQGNCLAAPVPAGG
jgi:hypothetical protein